MKDKSKNAARNRREKENGNYNDLSLNVITIYCLFNSNVNILIKAI